MARISATPNPVGVYSPNVGARTIIDWDTEIVGTVAKVFVSVNGADEVEVPGQAAAARRGSLRFQVTTPNSYWLYLRRASNMEELASATVTTFDLRQQLAAGFAASYLPQLRPQMITRLVVKPGVDTVRIAFRTTRPTIPTIGLYDASGAYLDGRMPLIGGLRTDHGAEFGVDRPLALGSKHKIVIDAFGATGNASTPNKVTQTVEFISGTRSADVAFESVDVHDDGDAGIKGAGEIQFSFGVGDRATGTLIGAPGVWPKHDYAEISDDDPPRAVGVTLPISSAPRVIWAQVIASDDDTGTLPLEHGVAIILQPQFEQEGSRYFQKLAADHAVVTASFDLGLDSGRFTIPFDMATGDFPLDYVMSGHVFVRANEGAVISTKIGKLGTLPQPSAFLTEPGSIRALAVGGVGERTDIVGLGADGAFYHRSLDRERRSSGGEARWTRVEIPAAAQVAVAASPTGILNLVAVNSDGAVTHREFDPSAPKRGKWRKLGGRFREVHPAVEPGRGRSAAAKLLLFGLGDDGSLHTRDAHSDGGDWSRLGDVPVRAIATAPAGAAAAAVFAVAEDGTLLSFGRAKGRWRQQALARLPGEARTQLLTVVPVDQVDAKSGKVSRELVIGAMGEDRQVRTLRWPDYPAGTPETRWQEAGSLQDLLLEEAARPAKRRRTSSRIK